MRRRPCRVWPASSTDGRPGHRGQPRGRPCHRGMQLAQTLASILLRTVSGLRWLTWVAAAAALADIWSTADWLPAVSWWWVLAGWLLLVSPAGRILLAAGGARLVLRDVQPGTIHAADGFTPRVWLAELWVGELGAVNLSTAPWMRQYARLLGAQVGRNVDLHAIPPVTGMLRLETAARSKPRSTWPATGSTATCCTWARSASARTRGSAPDRRSSRARTSVPSRRSRPVRRSSVRFRPVSGGPDRRPGGTVRRAGRCSSSVPTTGRHGWSGTPRRRWRWPHCRGSRPSRPPWSSRGHCCRPGRWAKPSWWACHGRPSRRPA